LEPSEQFKSAFPSKEKTGRQELDSTMEVEFRNVTITVANVTDAKQAYNRLCRALGSIACEWQTDAYIAYEPTEQAYADAKERDTSELFPTAVAVDPQPATGSFDCP
jgi:hypothetical protein